MLTDTNYGGSYEAASCEQGEVGPEVSGSGQEDPSEKPGEAGPGWLPSVSCYRPLKAFKTPAGDVRIGECRADSRPLELPCGRCIGCKFDRARSWQVRIMHEAQLYEESQCLTLTYDDAHLPASRSLEYPHFQGFMKRLRRHYSGVSVLPDGARPIRFFVAGEYGEIRKRPHFHAIVFNLGFKGLEPEPFRKGYFRSKLLEELWENRGVVSIGRLNPAAAAYVAGYTLNKVHGQAAKDHYEDVVDLRTGEVTMRRQELVAMSRRPGIGAWWYEKYARDLFPGDIAVLPDGRKWKVPQYYFRKFQEREDPGLVEEVVERRYQKAAERRWDATPERLAVREEVAWRKKQAFAERQDL